MKRAAVRPRGEKRKISPNATTAMISNLTYVILHLLAVGEPMDPPGSARSDGKPKSKNESDVATCGLRRTFKRAVQRCQASQVE